MAAVSRVAAYLAMGGYAAFVWPAYGAGGRGAGRARGAFVAALSGQRAAALERAAAEPRHPAMTRKQQRLGLLALGMAALAGATALVLTAFSDNLVFFYGPSELQAQASRRPAHPDRRAGRERTAVARRGRRTVVSFASPTARPISRSSIDGVLPDLFREGQGVVAEGRLRPRRRLRRRQRARQARREIHAARGRRRAEEKRALAGRRGTWGGGSVSRVAVIPGRR